MIEKIEKDIAQITGSRFTTRHSQYGDVPRARRCNGVTQRTNVTTYVGPLLRNCGSWYRPINFQAQNREGKRYKCKTVARRTFQAMYSLSLSASQAKITKEKKKKTT